jgi:hypothetical protein
MGEKYSESQNMLNIAITNPPAFFTYIVRGVGFEPTEAYARGSIANANL